MQDNLSLYEYLYQSLANQIECGVYFKDQLLPSQQQLCRRYNVGITTVRKAYAMLSENGYIRTASGQPAVVAGRFSARSCAAALAGRREEIADAFQGLGLLLPVLYAEGARRCEEPELNAMKHAIRQISAESSLPDTYSHLNSFFAALLSPFRSSLMTDLEMDAENYLHVPYIPFSGAEDPSFWPVPHLREWLQESLELILCKQYENFYHRLHRVYQEAAVRTDRYLQALAAQQRPELPKERVIRWFRVKERSELYAHLAMSILRRIASGEFSGQQYLPSIPKLMEEYGVMKDTVSRAIAFLNSMGVTQTIRRKGIILVPGGFQIQKGTAAVNFSDPLIIGRLSLFLEALQFITLTVRTSLTVEPSVPESEIRHIEAHLLSVSGSDQLSPLSVQLMMGLLIRIVPFHSLKNIYRQMNELLLWGYYLFSAEAAPATALDEILTAMENVVSALKNPQQTRLSDAFYKAFAKIYQDVLAVVATLPCAAQLHPCSLSEPFFQLNK